MEENELPKLALWIQTIRKNLHMDQAEFARHVCHYEMIYESSDTEKKNGKKVCSTYHRNQVGNWERGKSRNISIEGFLSIALLAYDHEHPMKYDRTGLNAERRERLNYAKEQLRKILGIELYSRNLHGALLIGVCRNLLSFKEVLVKEEEYKAKLSRLVLDYEEKREISLKRKTEMIMNKLYRIESLEELDQLIEKEKRAFYTADRTLGDRMVALYEKKPDRYRKRLRFQKAVQLYAPNYKDTYTRIFSSTEITKEWLMDLCRHLRFDAEEQGEILKLAHMQFVMEEDGEKKEKNRTLKAKFEIMVLLTFYVDGESEESLPPIEYLLESFSLYTHGQSAVKALRKLEGKKDSAQWEYEKIKKELEKIPSIRNWVSYVDFVYCEIIAANTNEEMKLLYQLYKAEHRKYYEMSDAKLKNVLNKEEAGKLHYLCALFYTVLLEKEYHGEVTRADMDMLKKMLEAQNEAPAYVYYFLSNVLGVFLRDDPLIECDESGAAVSPPPRDSRKFCVYDNKRKKNTKALDMEEICEDLWFMLTENE